MVVDSTFAFRRVPSSSQEPKTEHPQQFGFQCQPTSTQWRDDKQQLLQVHTQSSGLSDGANDKSHVPTLDELVEKARTDAIVELQRWWRRTHGNHKRITELQELCQDHANVLIEQKRRARIRAKIRELVLHAVFLYFYTVNTHFDVANEQLFRFTNAPTSQYLNADFKTATTDVKQFYGIMSADELFAWLRGPFLRLSYPQTSSSSASSSVDESDVVFQNSRVVGGIRIGQLRVTQSNCTSRITLYFPSALTESSSSEPQSWLYCYGSQRGEYENSAEYESRESFGGSDGISFLFAGHNDTKSTTVERSTMFSSMSGGSFPAPAFSLILPRANSTQASQINTCVCWLLLLLLLRITKHIDTFVRTLLLAKTKLLALLVCVALLMYGYASAFVVAVGPESSPFRRVAAAMTSLLGMAVGRAASSSRLLQQDQRDAPAIEIVLFTGFAVIHVVIVANLALVVISDAYHKAMDEVEVEFSSSKRMHLVVEAASEQTPAVPQVGSVEEPETGPAHIAFVCRARDLVVRCDAEKRQVDLILTSPRDGFEDDGDCNGAYNDDEDANARCQRCISTRANYTNPGIRNSQGVFDRRGGDRHIAAGGGARTRRSVERGMSYGDGSKSAATTKLLQGMILQLALQNETLLRSLDDVRKEVKQLSVASGSGVQHHTNATTDEAMRRATVVSPLSQSKRSGGGKPHASGRKQSTLPVPSQYLHVELEAHEDEVEQIPGATTGALDVR
ncbi:Polycystin 2, partial [Globisporangium splendens]